MPDMPDSSSEKEEGKDEDNGITLDLKRGARLPRSVADRMAPASVWVVYAAAAWIILHGLANFLAIVRKSLQ